VNTIWLFPFTTTLALILWVVLRILGTVPPGINVATSLTSLFCLSEVKIMDQGRGYTVFCGVVLKSGI
jgi:hypothetical protein